MGYANQVYKVPFVNSGLNASQNSDNIPPTASIDGSKNINLHKGGVGKRGGTEHIDAGAMSGTPQIVGLYDYTTTGGTQYILRATGDGNVYRDSTNTISTGLATDKITSFAEMNNKVYICNGADIPQVYGILSNTTNLGADGETPPTAATVALAGAGSGNVNNGTHSYQVTFVNVHGETTGGTTSAIVTVTDASSNGQVALSSIPVGRAGTTQRKIYRTVAGDTGNYKLVTTLSNNTATTYTDNTADGSLGADAPVTNTAALRPTDWVGTNYPKQMVNHGWGAGEQMWAFGCPSNPYSVYCSKDNAGGTTEAEFSDEETTVININTGDGYGIVGGFEFQDRLFAVGRKKIYAIQDTDADRSNWGYNAAGWTGGAASHRLVVVTPNDVHFMSDDGEIYSITAVQQYGDYKSASLTRPAFINNWIESNVNLQYVDKFHGVYDPELRAVKWFVVKAGETSVTTALVYFIDKNPAEGWAIHDNLTNDSGYEAVSSCLVKQTTGGYKVYTGNYVGIVWKLESATKSDNALGYQGVLKTPNLNFEDARTTKRYDRAFLSIRPVGNYNLNINIIYDSGNDGNATTMNMGSDGVVLDTFVLDTDKLAGDVLVENGFDLGYTGKRVGFEFSNSTAAQDFFISQMLIDFKPVGLRPST